VDGPVDKVKDSGGLPSVTFSEVGPDTGQPGEGPKLGWNMVGYCVCANRDAHATGGEERDGWDRQRGCLKVARCDLVTAFVELCRPREGLVWVFSILVAFDMLEDHR
jgi:hypothetical protein